jgi:hypothetical protein
MTDRTPLLKAVGAAWIVIGGIGLVWAGLTFVHGLFPHILASLASSVNWRLVIWPWAQICIIFVALFLLLSGWGLIRLQTWMQTILVPAHLLFAVYALTAWLAGLILMGHLYEGWAGLSLVLLGALAVHAAMAAFMGSVSTSEALSWLPLRTAPLVPLKCEFCGTSLDPTTGRCPQCEVIPETTPTITPRPPVGCLVGTSDEIEFEIEPHQAVTVGRGSAQNQVNLSNPTVSRHHAQISFENGHYVVTALKDKNGTFVNNARVRKRTLQDGDQVRFGRASFRFTVLEQEYRA